VPEQVVVGGSVAALVAADALAKRGVDVRLLVPERGIGGSFAKTVVDGRSLELGVRLLELSFEDSHASPPLSEYQPGPIGHRPFIKIIAGWVDELLGQRLIPVTRPEMLFGGRIVDDLYFTTDASALRAALTPHQLAVIAAEANACAARSGSAAGLLDPARGADLAVASFEEASRANHGDTLHELFMAPVADKLVGARAADVLATHRRKVWLPLFWPETIAQATSGAELTFNADRPFHTVSGGGTGELVSQLRRRLSDRGVRVETAGSLTELRPRRDGVTELVFAGIGAVEAVRPILGVSAEELFASVGAAYRPERATSVLGWIEADEADVRHCPSLLNIVDPDSAGIRISTGGQGRAGRRLFTVELRHDVAAVDIAATAENCLRASGLVTDSAELTIVKTLSVPSFPLPTRANATAFDRARSVWLEHGAALDIIGAGVNFGGDALSEQIIQGLRAAEVCAA
jgi:hypothetical protein